MKIRSFTRFWAIIAVTSLLVALILASWFLSLQATEQEVLDSYNQQQQLVVEGAAVSIESVFDDLQADLVGFTGLPEIQYFDEANARTAVNRKFNDLIPSGIDELGYLDETGTALVFAVRTNLERVDYAWRRYFKEAKLLTPNDNTLIIELDTSGTESILLIAIPVFETLANAELPNPSGAFRGVLVATLTIDTIAERFLLPFKPPASGQIFLIHDDLDVTWSSNSDMISRSLYADRDESIFEMRDAILAWGQAEVKSGAYTYEIVGRRNTTELIAFAPVRLESELFAIGVRTPGYIVRQTSLSTFQNQQIVLIGSVLVLVLGVILGGVVLNVETRRRFLAEEALRKSEREQAVLAERNRLASDLHDSVTQSLYGIVLHADAAKANLSAGKPDAAVTYLSEITEAGKEGLAEMRMLIFELRPPVLDEEGLEAALETRLYTVERRVGLQAALDWQIDGRLQVEHAEGLYRIAREALNNVLKHAEAQHLSLRFSRYNSIVRMEIEDDGVGFDLAAVEDSGGMGLAGMKERAHKLGASFVVESKLGEGTRLIVEVMDG